jgi:ABC-type transport system involved in Fe-S cluster assembly fused permease/ATPase subunit
LDAAEFAALRAACEAAHERGVTIVAAARESELCPINADEIVAIERGKTAGIGTYAALNFRA